MAISFEHLPQSLFGTFLGKVNSPPSLEPILVKIRMFTGGMIWILTHGHIPKSAAPPGHWHRFAFGCSLKTTKGGAINKKARLSIGLFWLKG